MQEPAVVSFPCGCFLSIQAASNESGMNVCDAGHSAVQPAVVSFQDGGQAHDLSGLLGWARLTEPFQFPGRLVDKEEVGKKRVCGNLVGTRQAGASLI